MSDHEELRKDIDDIDDRIILLLAERMHVATRIGVRKKETRVPVRDRERENEVVRHWKDRALALGLSAPLAARIAEIVMEMSRDAQEALR